ncbi:MAG: hypothetical protein KAW45_03000 [Thermoplasmatales archaeon]|nr:hypothetical protein [Thermoplasmatales archaeon]
MKNKFLIMSIIFVTVMLFSGCTTDQTNDNGETEGGTTDQNDTETEDCGNEIGNGLEIVRGPLEPDRPADRDAVFRSLAVDPLDSNIVYVGSERNGIFRSIDGGDTWEWLRKGIKHTEFGYPEIYYISISPLGSNDAVFTATTNGPGPLTGQYAAGAGIYKLLNGGDTWISSNCGLTHAGLHTVVFDLNNPDVLVAALSSEDPTASQLQVMSFPGGIFKTSDKGDNWVEAVTPSGSDKNDFSQIYSRGFPSTTFFTYGKNFPDPSLNLGFLKSIGGGDTWTKFGPFGANNQIYYFDISTDGMVFYAYEYSDSTKWMHKSVDGGETWTTQSGPFFGVVKVSPGNSNLTLFFGSNPNDYDSYRIYKSTDGLETYSGVYEIEETVEDIEFAQSNPNVVYAACEGLDIYKSTDAGSTWTKLINLRSEIINVE